jgi:triosephosphate isomerase (TIM)
VFSQHADLNLGAYTGSIPVEELKNIGVTGTLLNHSERRISHNEIKETLDLCKLNKLVTIICACTLSEIKLLAEFKPDYIAYEPAELIGGTISVTSAKPDIIIKAVQAVKGKTKLLVGAGVKTKKDIIGAIKFGAVGVLIGSAVPKAKMPREFLKKMLS